MGKLGWMNWEPLPLDASVRRGGHCNMREVSE